MFEPCALAGRAYHYFSSVFIIYFNYRMMIRLGMKELTRLGFVIAS